MADDVQAAVRRVDKDACDVVDMLTAQLFGAPACGVRSSGPPPATRLSQVTDGALQPLAAVPMPTSSISMLDVRLVLKDGANRAHRRRRHARRSRLSTSALGVWRENMAGGGKGCIGAACSATAAGGGQRHALHCSCGMLTTATAALVPLVVSMSETSP